MTGDRGAMRVANPLPVMLRHYTGATMAVLAAAGITANALDMPTAESVGSKPRIKRAADLMAWHARLRSLAADVLIVWPAFGLLEPVATRGSRGPRWIVVHDPIPLRPQFASGSLAMRIGRFGAGSGSTVLVHSESARAVLESHRWPVLEIPHPVMPSVMPSPASTEAPGQCLRVIGQWKPSRSFAPIEGLATDSEWAGRRQILGLGWPKVGGWEVSNRLMSEQELATAIRTSAAVLLPYERYFQSGVAVRCLEQAVPVVGTPTDFLVALYGADWPGLVRDGDWSAAVNRAAAVPRERIGQLHRRYVAHCVARWHDVFATAAGQ